MSKLYDMDIVVRYESDVVKKKKKKKLGGVTMVRWGRRRKKKRTGRVAKRALQ